MIITPYSDEDYHEVAALIATTKMPVPTKEELKGYSLVGRNQGSIIAFVWALTNSGSSVYIDYFVVDKNVNSARESGLERSKFAVQLMVKLLNDLMVMGKTRIIGTLSKDSISLSLERTYSKVGMQIIEPHCFVTGDIKEIFNNIIKLSKG